MRALLILGPGLGLVGALAPVNGSADGREVLGVPWRSRRMLCLDARGSR